MSASRPSKAVAIFAGVILLAGASAIASLQSPQVAQWLFPPVAPPPVQTGERLPTTPQEVLLEAAGETAAIPDGWPNLFGPSRDCTSPETDIVMSWGEEGPPELWRLDIGIGYASPVAADGRVLLYHRVEEEEVLACLNAESGEPVWEHRYPCTYHCRFEHSSGPYSTPIIHDGSVFIQGAEGIVKRLSFETGEVIWERNLSADYAVPENIYAVGHTPLLEGDRLIINAGGTVDDSGIVAISTETGETIWTATTQGASYSTPQAATIHDQRYVFVMTAEGLVALDPEDGTVFFERTWRAKHKDAVTATSPLIYGDLVVISVYQKGTLCLRVLPDNTFEEVWMARREFVSQFNPMTCVDGYVYGWNNLDKSFRCFDITSCEVQWYWYAPLGRGTHVLVGDQFIVFGESGQIAVVDANPQELIHSSLTKDNVPLEREAFSAPALADGLMFLRNEKQLVCLDLRP